MNVLDFKMWLPWSVEASFGFFTDVTKLDHLTPRWFRLVPRAPVPAPLALGARIHYRMKWRGWSGDWGSVIREWQPPIAVAYEQGDGPFNFYRHEHRFCAERGGTALTERVSFSAPGGDWVDRLLVAPDLKRIFRFREEAVKQWWLQRPAEYQHLPGDP